MGVSSIWHWLIVLIIVMLVFGTKKLGSIGTDLGKAVKGFKEGMNDEEQRRAEAPQERAAEKAAKLVDAEEK